MVVSRMVAYMVVLEESPLQVCMVLDEVCHQFCREICLCVSLIFLLYPPAGRGVKRMHAASQDAGPQLSPPVAVVLSLDLAASSECRV
jgi:hypothetical protein